MSSRHAKRGILVTAGAMAGVLGLSSAAFACTIWSGKMTVTAVSTGPGNTSNGSVTGYGANMQWAPGAEPEGVGSSMQYCGGGQPAGDARVDQDPSTGLGTIDVTVASHTCEGREWKPGDNFGVWAINWLPNEGYDCMNGIRIGTFNVPSGATSVTTRVSTVPNGGFSADALGGYQLNAGRAAICADAPTINGMQVPITVL